MPDFFGFDVGFWNGLQTLSTQKYTCGYCNAIVASEKGYDALEGNHSDPYYRENEHTELGRISICPHCFNPTVFRHHQFQLPLPLFGREVERLPDAVSAVYQEARRCSGNSSPNAVAMLCRKLLMHIAIEKGASNKASFETYVNYLDEQGYIPKSGKEWVDYIRKIGNDANHKIQLIDQEAAERLLSFTEHLLRNIYELPSLLPNAEDTR